MYHIQITRNLSNDQEVYDNATFSSLKELLEGIAQDMKVYSTATSFVYTIVPPKA